MIISVAIILLFFQSESSVPLTTFLSRFKWYGTYTKLLVIPIIFSKPKSNNNSVWEGTNEIMRFWSRFKRECKAESVSCFITFLVVVFSSQSLILRLKPSNWKLIYYQHLAFPWTESSSLAFSAKPPFEDNRLWPNLPKTNSYHSYHIYKLQTSYRPERQFRTTRTVLDITFLISAKIYPCFCSTDNIH